MLTSASNAAMSVSFFKISRSSFPNRQRPCEREHCRRESGERELGRAGRAMFYAQRYGRRAERNPGDESAKVRGKIRVLVADTEISEQGKACAKRHQHFTRGDFAQLEKSRYELRADDQTERAEHR